MSVTFIISPWAYLPNKRPVTPSKLFGFLPMFWVGHSGPSICPFSVYGLWGCQKSHPTLQTTNHHCQSGQASWFANVLSSVCSNATPGDNLSSCAAIFYRLPAFYFPLIRGSSLYVSNIEQSSPRISFEGYFSLGPLYQSGPKGKEMAHWSEVIRESLTKIFTKL